MARQQGTDLGDVKTRSGGDKVRVSDKVTLYEFPPKKWMTFRIHGGTYSYSTYWVTGLNKDKKKIKFPVNSPSYDPTTQDYDSTKYDPWRDLSANEADLKPEERLVQISNQFYINAILRLAQKNEPRKRPPMTSTERKSGFKEKDSDSWTPNVALRLPGGAVEKIKKLSGLNTVESRKTGATKSYPVSHPKFGCDIRIYYDPDAAPASKYDVQLVDKKTPLTEEELAELTWDLSELATEATEQEVRRDFEGWAKRMGIKTSKKRKHDVEENEEDLDEDGFDEDDEDEDEAPKSKKKVAAKKTSKKAPAKRSRKDEDEDEEDDEDDFEEDEEDEEDEDEDDEPKSRSKKKAPAKKKTRKDEDDFDEDEDEDEEDEDEDEDDEEEDEDDTPKRRTKKAPAKKTSKSKKKVDDDDDFDEDDEEDEDEDNEEDEDEDEDDEPRRRGAKKKVAAKKSSKRSRDEDEDEDEEDEDEDEDEDEADEDEEEDEPPKRRRPAAKKVPAKKAVKKRR
jgi:hypothetical protein